MRTLNSRFAAALVLLLCAIGVGVYFLHRVQYDRITSDLRWQVDRARDAGNIDEAITHAYRYLEFKPDDANVLVELAGWLEQRPGGRKHLASVVNLLERALRAEPQRTDVRRRVVGLDLRLGQYGECLDHLDRLLADAPNDPELLSWLGESKQWTGKHAEAAQAYEKAIKADPKRIFSYIEYSNLLGRHLRRPDDARKALETAVKVNPSSPEAQLALARHFRGAGKINEAEVAVNQAVQLAPQDVSVLIGAGEITQAAGKIRQAREYFQKASEIDPKNGRCACTLAWLMLYDGKTNEAAEKLRTVIRDNPSDVDALTLLGDILALDGRMEALEAVVDDLEKVRRTAPARSWNADYLKSRLLMRRGDWVNAATQLERLRIAAAKAPNMARQASYLQAQCYEQLGERERELEAYRHVVDAESSIGFFRMEYCRALARAGQFGEAAAQFRLAVQRSDVPPRSVTDGAVDLVERCTRGNAEKVIHDLERTFTGIRVDDPSINSVLAKVELLRLRRRDAEALQIADAYLVKHPLHSAMHAARARVLNVLFGSERALVALDEAQNKLGDLADFRITRLRVLATRAESAQSGQLLQYATGLDRFSPEDRTHILMELIAATGATGDTVQMGRALEMLRMARPDHVAVRSVLLTRSLAANDHATIEKLLAEVSAVEGPQSWTVRRFEVERLLKAVGVDPTAAVQARTKLTEMAQARPGDPMIEFLQGRLDEVEGHPTAIAHYRNALDRGLLDQPIEEQFWTLGREGAQAKVRILLEDSPLIERLRLEQDRAVVRSILPLVGASGRAALADRLMRANAEATAPQLIWLGRMFQQLNLNRFADSAFAQAAKFAPRSADVWSVRFATSMERDGRAKVADVIEEARRTLAADAAPAVMGRALQAAGLNAEAAQEYRRAIEAQPRDADARRQLAMIYTQSGKIAEAREQLKILVDRPDTPDDDRRWARRTLAVNLTIAPSRESFESSVRMLEANKSTTGFGDDDASALALVYAVQKDRVLDGGETARKRAIGILEGIEKNSGTPSASDLVLLARLYQSENDSTGFRRVAARLEADGTTSFTALSFLAQQALQAEDFATADRCLVALGQIAPGRIETLSLQFARQALAGEIEPALAGVKAYIAAATPGAGQAMRIIRCGHLIFEFQQSYPLGDKPEVAARAREAAIQLYEQALGRDPHALLRLVSLQGRQGQIDKAFDLLMTPAVKKNFSTEAVAAAMVAAVRNGSAKPQQLQAVEKQLLEWTRRDAKSTALTLAYADLCDHQRQYDKAAEMYRDVLSREPNCLIALNNLAWIMSHDQAKIDDSLRMIQEAIDRNGPLADLLDTRSRIRFAKGDRDGGMLDLTEAIREAPSAARYLQLAHIHRQAGRTELAEDALRRARRFGLSPADVHPLDAGAYRDLVRN